LSWVVIPIIQEYEKAPDFTVKDKLKRALKTNLMFYVIIAVLGLAFVFYMVIKKQFTSKSLTAFLIAVSNAWGIFLIIMLFGYGLVAIPKSLWKEANLQNRQKYLEWNMSNLKDELEDKKAELGVCLTVIIFIEDK